MGWLQTRFSSLFVSQGRNAVSTQGRPGWPSLFPTVSVEGERSPSDLNYQPARLGAPPFFFLQFFVLLQTGENPHPRIIAVNDLTIDGQSAQIEEDRQRRIGYCFISLELDGFRQRHAKALLQPLQPVPGQACPVLGQGQRNVAGRVVLLRPHARR